MADNNSMQESFSSITVVLTLSFVGTPAVAEHGAVETGRIAFFEKKIRPVLIEHCYGCHNSSKAREGGLALDSRDAIRAASDTGTAVVPGDPQASLLLRAIRHQEPGLRMPKDGVRLSEEVITDFARWIEEGAADPRDEPPTMAGLLEITSWDAVRERRKKWWSFQPLTSPQPPAAVAPDASTHPVDRFLRARMDLADLDPSPQTDRRTLIRRLSFVLTGLPPRPEWVEACVSDPHPLWYEQLVDRLLASPQFGERWARHWMDWLRYSETHGSEGDPSIPQAWLYRDYLIRALNEDVPYNQLVREHLAGDLLESPRLDASGRLNDSALGTAHFRFVQHGYAPTDAVAEEVRFTDDQIDVVTKAFLGLTVSCARCHDHKFDPISQRDYYALYGIFTSWRPALNELDVELPEDARRKRDLASLKERLRAPLANAWHDGARSLGTQLLGSRGDLPTEEDVEKARPKSKKERKKWERKRRQPSTASGWGESFFEAALHDKPNPLHAWIRLARVGHDHFEQEWQALVESYRESRDALQAQRTRQYRRHWDLRGDDWKRWYAQGSGVPDGPSPAGTFHILAEGDRVVADIYPAGLYSHLISDKHGMLIGSPEFLADCDTVWLKAMGGGRSRLRFALNGYPRTDGPIYDRESLTREEPRWFKFDIEYWRGDQVYLEAGTAGDVALRRREFPERSWFGISEIVFGNKDDEAPRIEAVELVAPLFEAASANPPRNVEDLAALYGRAVEAAVSAWEARTINDAQARFLGFFVRRQLLPNSLEDLAAATPLVKRYRSLEDDVPLPTRAPGVSPGDRSDQPLFVRGNHRERADPVPQRFFEFLDTTPYPGDLGGRLQLAQDLVRSDNPLTARVIANRLWHYVFGLGLVASPDNFGRLGEPPSHPQLLDYLAARLGRDGWSLKRMIRLLVTSDAFRRSAVPQPTADPIDPDNRLLSHWRLRRLEAEAIRDTLLSVSGQLEPRMFGPSIEGGEPRRSVYVQVRRDDLDPFLTVFDAPFPGSTTGRRAQTNVPAQSLTLLNDPFVTELAATWAEKTAAHEPRRRIEGMYLTALGRPPAAEEMDAALRFVEVALARAGAVASAQRRSGGTSGAAATEDGAEEPVQDPGPWQELAQSIFSFKEFLYLR